MDKKLEIKEKVEELVKRLQSDKKLLDSFQKDPIKTIEKLLGVDLPDDQLKPLVTRQNSPHPMRGTCWMALKKYSENNVKGDHRSGPL